MNGPITLPRRARWLILATAVLSAFEGGLTLILPDVLTGPAVTNGNARGTGLIVVVLAVPVLLAGTWLAVRGSARGVVIVLGALGYLAYNDAAFLFATPFNRLFLLSVAAASVTVFTIAVTLHSVDARRIARQFEGVPARAIAGYVWVVVALNALVWLRVAVPASFAERPGSFLDGSGLTTNPFYIQDLVFWLPGAAVVAWWLWHRRPWGIVLGAAWLVYGLLESITVATDQWFGTTADPNWPAIASYEGAALFLALAVITLVPLSVTLRPRAAGRTESERPLSGPGARPSATPATR